MIYLGVTFIIFLLTVVGHIGYHRLTIWLGKKSFKTIRIFFLGFLLNSYFMVHIFMATIEETSVTSSPWLYPLPLSGAFFYIMLFFSYIIYSASPYLGQEGPTSKLLMLLQKHPNLTEEQIVDSFTDEETILDRIADLIRVQWIIKRSKYMKITTKGAFLAKLLLWYRALLHVKYGG